MRSSIFVSPVAIVISSLASMHNGDNVAKFALALGSLGNVRARAAYAGSVEEFLKLVSELS